MSRRTRQLGWYVVLGSLAAALVQSFAATERERIVFGTGGFGLHWPGSAIAVLAGIGLITMGRIISQSAWMQREIDATV